MLPYSLLDAAAPHTARYRVPSDTACIMVMINHTIAMDHIMTGMIIEPLIVTRCNREYSRVRKRGRRGGKIYNRHDPVPQVWDVQREWGAEEVEAAEDDVGWWLERTI